MVLLYGLHVLRGLKIKFCCFRHWDTLVKMVNHEGHGAYGESMVLLYDLYVLRGLKMKFCCFRHWDTLVKIVNTKGTEPMDKTWFCSMTSMFSVV